MVSHKNLAEILNISLLGGVDVKNKETGNNYINHTQRLDACSAAGIFHFISIPPSIVSQTLPP